MNQRTWKLEKKFTFEAAHRLPLHDGKCQRLHGHSWVGWLVFEHDGALACDNAKTGMVYDFADISAIIKPIVEQYLDHYYLNESIPLEHPTSENVAKWIYDKVKGSIKILSAVVIEETCTSRCEYRPL